VSEKESGLERQQEELKHLVRISEQRRWVFDEKGKESHENDFCK